MPLTVEVTFELPLYSSVISSKHELIMEKFEIIDLSDSAHTVQRVGHNGLIPIVSGGSFDFSFKSTAFFLALYLNTLDNSRILSNMSAITFIQRHVFRTAWFREWPMQ